MSVLNKNNMEKGSTNEQELMKQETDSKQRGTENKCRINKDTLIINIKPC